MEFEVRTNNPKILETIETRKFNKEEEKETDRLIHQYIFDEDKILKTKVFTQSKISDSLFAYGNLLPKEVEIKLGKRKIKDQEWSPVLILSNNNMIEINSETEQRYKVKFNPIPNNLNLGWSLSSIKDYLNNKVPEIEGDVLFKRVKFCYEKDLFFREKTWYNVHALWDMGTYFFMLFDNYPLFENRGITGTAKSKSMTVSSLISFNPTEIMINPSEATLFRETNEKRPTKYIDEAEKLFRYDKMRNAVEPDSRAELINASYYKNGSVPRVEKILGRFVTMYYKCYSPTQISSIRGLYGATETRAITHIMTKAPDEDNRGETEPDINDSIWQITKDDLHIFALQNWKKVDELYKNLNVETKLKKRDLQLWKPLLVLAKLINEDLLNEVKEFAERISEQRKQDFIPESSLDYKILESLKFFIDSNVEKIYIEKLKNHFIIQHKGEVNPGFNRTISSRLDNLGFKDLRDKDRDGAYFTISKEDFEVIIAPICPNLSSQSSQSSQSSYLPINNKNNDKICDEEVMNRDEKGSKECDECDENDECDGSIERKATKGEQK